MKKVIFKYCLILIFLTAFINSATGITAGFSYTKVSNCAPTIVRFTNSSSSGLGITYIWNFGLGAVVTANDNSSKEQVYTKSGNYTVTLKVTDGVNTDSTSMTIAIAMGPAAGFTADKVIGCAPLTVNLTSSSTAGDAEITKTLWDFRNGVYKEGLSVQNSYSNTGTYDLNLTVTDKNGCSSILSSEKAITVTEKPHVSFAASDTFACRPPLSVYYTNNSTGASDLAWKWNFGNGENSSELSGSSVYRINGNYSVKLTATDLYGCSDSLLRKSYITVGYPKGTLSVYDANGIKVDKSYLCNGSYVFKYSTTGLPEYIWKITEEGKTSVINGTDSLMYKVEGSGSIDIKVVYGKSSFCTDSASISFVKSYVKADFTIGDTLLCMLPSVIKLKSSSQNTDSLDWYFSGRLFSNNDTADYTVNRKDMPAETWEQLYSHKINYVKFPVKLVASIGRACYDSIKKNITIALPRARFMPDKVSGCIPLQVTFSDSSKSVNSVDSYKFKIGSDSVTSTVKSPVSYTFTKAGEYDVTEIISSRGCIDTSMNIRIVAGDKLTPDFTITPGEVCNDGIVHLTGDTGNNSLVNTWRFRSPDLFDISFSSRPDSDIVVYTDTPGLHNVSLMADYNGCQSETSKTGILKINGPAGSFKETMSCDSSLIYQFKSTMSPATSYLWKIGNDTIANTDSVKYKFPLNVNYLVQLTATDAGSNCSLTRSKIIKVRKVVSAFTVSDSTICVGDTVRLYSTKSQDYISNCYNEGFLWNFGDDSPPRRAFETKYDHKRSSY